VDSPSVIIERNDSFAIIRLNSTDELNELSQEMIVAIADNFTYLESQPALRAIILTGAGDQAFCAGTGITKLTEPRETREILKHRQALYNQIANSPVPVIAAVNGIAADDGCELALACHLRIASSNAFFSLLKTKIDSISAPEGPHRLVREIGKDLALEICQSGRAVPAAEALRIGLINRIAADGQLLIEAESLARQIAGMAPLAIRACLAAVTRGTELPLAEGLALEAQLFSSLFATDDVREGTSAFLEKRRPVFQGK
jgi:enoyl-CoA hydratase